MAASIRSQLHLLVKKRCLLFQSCKTAESFTYCQKVFYSRFIKEQTSGVSNHIITKDSKLDEDASLFLEQSCVGASGHVNYRRHHGAMRRTTTKLPARLMKSMKVLLERYPVESLTTKTQKLVRYLQARQPPVPNKELSRKAREVEARMFEKDETGLADLEGEEFEAAKKEREKIVLSKLRTLVYHWQPMQYDAFTSYIYLMGRTASDYAVHTQCFTEILKRDPDFKPLSIFNFGSKVGAGVWAAEGVWKAVGEHYCVDSSGFMNTIARLLLQDGNEQNSAMFIKGVHFRQFAPSSKQNTFSMVVCPYMLMEQASDKERLQLVLDLWEMTDTYLVLIENGSNAGFSLIDEAREFVLQLSANNPESPYSGHVFAPCPHDLECPKKRDKNQSCLTECVNTEVDFSSKKTSSRKTFARYSYVILKKGQREAAGGADWPRVLQHSKAKRHNHCHLCLPCGHLQHVVITKGKFDKHLYGCSKHVTQGDCLPVSLSPTMPDTDTTPDSTSHCDHQDTEPDLHESDESTGSEDKDIHTRGNHKEFVDGHDGHHIDDKDFHERDYTEFDKQDEPNNDKDFHLKRYL